MSIDKQCHGNYIDMKENINYMFVIDIWIYKKIQKKVVVKGDFKLHANDT